MSATSNSTPSFSAHADASIMSWCHGQSPNTSMPSSFIHVFMYAARMSAPSCFKSAIASALSTPPERATIIFPPPVIFRICTTKS